MRRILENCPLEQRSNDLAVSLSLFKVWYNGKKRVQDMKKGTENFGVILR
jgi:hypothetical protein